ncbi:MAG: dihydropteroate synthase [Methanosarcinaceae archaeon]|nr:dihydropteroate synthase [Methanosarcinaceae archaeon]
MIEDEIKNAVKTGIKKTGVRNKICGLSVGINDPPHVMGILNLSPESFYKSSVKDENTILEAALKMVEEGATMLDIGARSTSPWAPDVPVDVEKERLFKALDAIRGNVDCVISVDTMYAEIAEGALNRGAHIINDESGLIEDPNMAKVIADYDASAVLMATEKVRGDPLGMDAVISSLEKIIENAVNSGIDENNIILDPAIGKWIPEKEPFYDYEVLDRFEELNVFNMPVMIAISRKSFMNDVLKKPAEKRLAGTLGATAVAVYKGGRIIRAHDIKETLDAANIAYTISMNEYKREK